MRRNASLRERIYVERRSGAAISDWAKLREEESPARIRPLSPSGENIDGARGGESREEITLRWNSFSRSIKAGDRAVDAREGDVYNIIDVDDFDETRREIKLICARVRDMAETQAAAVSVLNGEYVEAILHKAGGSLVSNGRGGFRSTSVSEPINALLETRSEMLATKNVESDNALIYVLNEVARPVEGDRIEIGGDNYFIEAVTFGDAQAVFECKCRKE